MQMSESEFQKAVIERLHWAENQRICSYLRINSGALTVQRRNRAGEMKTSHIRLARAGTSDIILFFRGGRTVFVELKSATGRQSEKQKAFEDRMRDLGYEYHIVSSLNQINMILNLYAI